ncbi:MAG: class I SAM-dependent methyltransferase [Gammaproteobacteria bacterium]|nr:methyltransferase [Gammaproteobacteria bacterium]NNC97520.1 class I SAM-dependent methyltransferase [Gammaproteobacteria bacterium]NNM14236.1 class I SAM-dependent methyltransferase [Gammaproteobacteria bacterium]
MKSKIVLSILVSFTLSACMSSTSMQDKASITSNVDIDALQKIVTQRPAELQARDKYRNPVQTLAFFKVEPGMTVGEVLPGGGWYTRIIADYLGTDGTLYAVNYNDDMWARFGFFPEEFIAEQVAAMDQFPDLVKTFTDNGVAARGFTFASVPDEVSGTLDRVLFIRAMHNLNRFEAEAGTRSQALQATYNMLKPGGMVGVVQHRLQEDATNDKADGSRGYLKQSDVIEMFEEAGFKLLAKSEINANPKDQPNADDVVWRLPPSMNGTGDDPEKREMVLAIGESDRMTLLFKKK